MLDKNVEEEDIKKNYKTISKYFEEEDAEFLSSIEKQKRAEQKKVRDRFMEVINKRREIFNQRKEEREKLFKETVEAEVEVEFIREEILQTTEEVLNSE